MKLKNAKHERFCLEYSQSGDTVQAYIKSGYKVKDNLIASRCARRLLELPTIQARLGELHKEIHSTAIASAAEVQERLTRILRMEETEDVVVVEGVDKGISEAKIVQKRPMLKDVIKAGETLAKMQGAFDSSVRVSLVVPQFGGEDELEE